MDRIRLDGIACRCRIGVPAAERKRPQAIAIDLVLELDTAPAASRDEVGLTADYAAIEKAVRALAEKGERRLIESLAEQVAKEVLRQAPLVKAVSVSVRKRPAAMPKTREVAVEIRRLRRRS